MLNEVYLKFCKKLLANEQTRHEHRKLLRKLCKSKGIPTYVFMAFQLLFYHVKLLHLFYLSLLFEVPSTVEQLRRRTLAGYRLDVFRKV